MAPERMSASHPEHRRQRRIAQRRRQILAAAAQLFADQGYTNTSTKEIALRTDMGESTLYGYFSSKRDILLAIARETEPLLLSALQQAGPLDNRTAMIELFERALNISEAQLPFARALVTEAWVDDDILHEFLAGRLLLIHRALAAIIAECVAAGVFRPIDPALSAQLLMGMFAGLILPAMRGLAPLPSPEQRHTLAETIVSQLLDGVLNRSANEASQAGAWLGS
jgi:AcrR family transcriptional regulator